MGQRKAGCLLALSIMSFPMCLLVMFCFVFCAFFFFFKDELQVLLIWSSLMLMNSFLCFSLLPCELDHFSSNVFTN